MFVHLLAGLIFDGLDVLRKIVYFISVGLGENSGVGSLPFGFLSMHDQTTFGLFHLLFLLELKLRLLLDIPLKIESKRGLACVSLLGKSVPADFVGIE